MKLLDDRGMNSSGYVFLRNALNDAIHGTEFIQSLQNSMESTICELFGKLTGKASEVVDKLKSQTQLAVAPKS
jgi:hypothetical protein